MRRVPRRVPAAGAVEMSKLRCTLIGASPVGTSMIGRVGESPSVRLRASENVVLIRRIAEAFYRVALLSKRTGFGKVVAKPSDVERVAVEIRNTACDLGTFGS